MRILVTSGGATKDDRWMVWEVSGGIGVCGSGKMHDETSLTSQTEILIYLLRQGRYDPVFEFLAAFRTLLFERWPNGNLDGKTSPLSIAGQRGYACQAD